MAMLLSKRIRELREGKRLSQGDIEKRTGLLRSYISRVENGHTVPSLETLERLAAGLDVPLYQLFYEGEGPAPTPETGSRKSVGKVKPRDGAKSKARFVRLRKELAENSRASDDANLAFGTLAKLFSRI
jgi:transcriptional regulator with XRE-family HTH domain